MRIKGILAIGGLLVSCAPRAVYVSPVDTFATQAEKFNTAVEAELAQYPTDFRARQLRREVSNRIIFEGQHAPGATFSVGEFGDFICKPRVKTASYADESRYLGAVSEALKKTTAAPSDKLKDLIAALGTSYRIDVAPPGDNDEQARCNRDLSEYRATAYPFGQTETIVGAIAGVKALEAIFEELAPAILTQVDEARRSVALQQFLSDTNNQNAIRASISNNVAMLESELKNRRNLSLNVADIAYAGYGRKLAALNVQAIPECKSFKGSSRPYDSDSFRACFGKVWDASSGEAAAVLTAAAKYDEDAAKRPDVAGNELNKLVDKLARLARGNLTPGEWAQALSSFAKSAVAIDTLANTATSADTKKKVEDALNQIKGI